MITDAYVKDTSGLTTIIIVHDAGSPVEVPYNISNEELNSILPGAVEYLQANEVKPTALSIKREILRLLDMLTHGTQKFLLEKDGWYNGRSIEAIAALWPEFFEFQKWLDDGEIGATPNSPRLDIEAGAMIRYTPSLNILRAKKRIAAEFRRKRTKLMIEEIDGAGNLIRFTPKQTPEINAQIFKYKRETNKIYKDATLSILDKIVHLYDLKKEIEGKYRNGRFKLKDD